MNLNKTELEEQPQPIEESSQSFLVDEKIILLEEKLRFLEQELSESQKIKEERDYLLVREQLLQQQLQTALQNGEDILENITDAFFTLDNDWRFVYLNIYSEKFLAKSRQELLGRSLWEEYPDAASTIFYHKYQQAMHSRETVHFEGFWPPLNSWFDVHAYPSQQGLSIYLLDINEKKQAQQEVAEQQQVRLSTNLNATTEGIFEVDRTGRCTFINRAALSILGYTQEECVDQLIHQLIHYKYPDGTPYPFENCSIFQSILSGKPVRLKEEVLWRKDGSGVPTLYSCSPIIQSGKITGGVVTILDLRERKQAAALLEETESRFRVIWEAASDAVALSDAEGTVLAANPAYFTLYGYTPEEVVGHNYSVIFPPEIRQFAKEQYNHIFSGPKTVQAYEALVTRSDGTPRMVEASYDFIVQNGVRTAMVSVVRDITERKQAEQERNNLFKQLEAEQARLRALIENVPAGILLAEAPSGQIVMANQQAEVLLKLPNLLSHIDEEYNEENKEAEGNKGTGNWYHTSASTKRISPLERLLARALAGETVQGNEQLLVEKSGTSVCFLINAIPIRNQSGEVVRVVITFYDISERKRTEQIERFLIDFAAKLLPLAQEEKVFQTAATFLGRFLKANRCFFAGFDFKNSQAMVVYYNYLKGKEVENLEGTFDLTSIEPKVLRQLRAGKPVVIGEVRLSAIDEELQESLWSFKSSHFKGQTMVVVPLLRQGNLELVVGVQAPSGRRQWQKDEVGLLQSVLERVGLSAQNARLFRKAQEVAVLEERARIARDLHDSLQQEFYGIQLSTNITLALLRSYPGINIQKVFQQLEETVQLAEGGLVELRSLIFDLMPESLAKQGLVAGLQNYVHTLQARHRLRVTSELGGEPPIKAEIKEILYFIARETVFNIVKHAQASEVAIKLVWNGEKRFIELTIIDNGLGFEQTRTRPGHYGIESIKERTHKAGGTANIQSQIGKGTSIQVVLPV